MRRAILVVAFFLGLAAPARASLIQDFSGFQSGTHGIALGPDGNFWVAEQYFGDSVARMTPAGRVLDRFTVGAEPTSVALGPDGTVWVAVKGARRLVWFDATAAAPTAHTINTPGGFCGPDGLTYGGNQRMYFALPDDCGGSPGIGYVATSGGAPVVLAAPSASYDIAVFGGAVFAPEPSVGEIRRYGLDLSPAGSIAAPEGPWAIAIDAGGTGWVTQFNGGVARFSATQAGGRVTEFPPSGGTLGEPYGLVIGGDGNVYATGKTQHNLARVSPAGTYKFFDVGDGEPYKIVNGLDGDLYFTDQKSSRVRRFLSAAPRATTGAIAGVATTVATASASVDSRGNDTTVVFDYGPTTAYGSSVTTTIPAAAGPAPVSAVLPNLTPGTAYHVRVRATNAEGSATGADAAFTTMALPTPTLPARANFSWRFYGSKTALTKVTVTDLQGGETIKVTCKSKRKGCKFSSKTYKNITKPKKDTKSLTSLFGRKRPLKTGAKIEVRITAPGAIGSSATTTIGKRKRDPKIVRKRINP